jgi:hypothetical protein
VANEISVNVKLSVNNGIFSDDLSASGRFDQSTQASAAGVLLIGTAVQTLTVGDVASIGFVALRNLSTATAGTSYVAIGSYDGSNMTDFVALRRGQPALMPLKSDVVIGARAVGNSARLQYIVLSE